MTELTRDIRFKYALIAVLIMHSFIFYRPAVEKILHKAALSMSNSAKNLRVTLKSRTFERPKPKKVIKKKISKIGRKKVPKAQKVIEQKIEKVQAAIMKTVFNSNAQHMPTPRYPRRAQRRGIQGKVLVSILIGIDGLPYNATISKSSGHDILDNAALKAAMEWKFTPALVNGSPVKSANNQSFVFSLQNR